MFLSVKTYGMVLEFVHLTVCKFYLKMEKNHKILNSA